MDDEIITDDIKVETVADILYPVVYEHNPIPKKGRFRFLKIVILIIFAGFGVGFGISIGNAVVLNVLGISIQTPQPRINLNGGGLMAYSLEPLSMVEAVDIVKPSVVSIRTTVPRNPLVSNRIFDTEDAQSSGTGIVFYETYDRYYIVTNEHVIENATEIQVAFGRSTEVTAYVFGRDRESDLAVIYVYKSYLEIAGIRNVGVARFGDSSDMQIGEVVMAIGNALGQGITTTMGVVSATDIRITIDQRNLSVLQTDATINRGNSGGPLINSRGEIIGINTAKVIRDNAIGMGYSITSNAAMPIISMILNEETPPRLGINIHDLDSMPMRYIEEFGLEDKDYGLLIARIQYRSGAYFSDLEVFDFITHFNGELVRDLEHLRDMIEQFSVRDTVTLTVVRGGEVMDIEVTFLQW